MSLLLVPAATGLRTLRAARVKALGLLMLVVLVGLVVVAILAYNHSPIVGYAPTTEVSLDVTSVGDQLTLPAEVELRGIDVGQVTGERVSRSDAVARLQLDRSDLALIPANVTAEILPKTLFGEKFVNLVLPAHPVSARLGSPGHTVIGPDDSAAALEVETVFDNLLPLLRDVQPAQLDQTLSAVADALQGQSTSLGDNLVAADNYLAGLNPHLPQLDVDIDRLAVVSREYTQAVPALLTTLGNLSTTSRTVVRTQDQLAGFLSSAIGVSGTATSVLDRNASDLIQVAAGSRPLLGVLQEYSPELPCLAGGLADLEPDLNRVFSTGALHLTILDVPDRGGYTAADAPAQTATPRPYCYGLPNNKAGVNYIYPGPPSANAEPGTPGVSGPPAAESSDLALGQVGSVGSPAEQAQIAGIVAADGATALTGATTGIGDLLLGPLLRGTAVGLA